MAKIDLWGGSDTVRAAAELNSTYGEKWNRIRYIGEIARSENAGETPKITLDWVRADLTDTDAKRDDQIERFKVAARHDLES